VAIVIGGMLLVPAWAWGGKLKEMSSQQLISVLETGNNEDKINAAKIFAERRDKAAVPALSKNLNADPEVALHTAFALGMIADPRAVPALCETIGRGEKLTWRVLGALADIGDPGGAACVQERMSAMPRDLVRKAIWTIAISGNETSVPFMEQYRAKLDRKDALLDVDAALVMLRGRGAAASVPAGAVLVLPFTLPSHLNVPHLLFVSPRTARLGALMVIRALLDEKQASVAYTDDLRPSMSDARAVKAVYGVDCGWATCGAATVAGELTGGPKGTTAFKAGGSDTKGHDEQMQELGADVAKRVIKILKKTAK
jgi:hypothetical protein